MSRDFQFLLYKTAEEEVSVNALIDKETIWLTQKAMAGLFDCSTDNISLHLKNVFSEGELSKEAVTEKISVTASDGKNIQLSFIIWMLLFQSDIELILKELRISVSGQQR